MKYSDLFLERVGRFALLPVIHHSYEFALAARAAFEQLNPCALALEYPAVLQDLVLQGIRRLPRISILLYGGGKGNYIRIEPVDPFIETARLALKRGLKVQYIDLAMLDYPQIYEPIPDTYAVTYLGHRKYCEMVLEYVPSMHLEGDESRERAMAYHLQEMEPKLDNGDRPVLVLCGLSHFHGLKEQLDHKQPQPFQPHVPAKLYHLSSASLGEIMGFFPFFTAVYELQRNPAAWIHDSAPAGAHGCAPTTEGLKLLEGKKAENLPEYVVRAHKDTADAAKQDRYDILTRYMVWCRAYYEHEIGDRISPQQILLMDNFARKYAHIKSMLLPDFYELLIAGRGSINSHFCYRMWEIGTFYAPQQGATELEVIELRAEDIFPLINKVRMNPHAPLKPRAAMPRFLRRREKQRRHADPDWRFNPYSICSYPPEDIVIEGYGQYLRSKGKNMLSEERKRVQPFETSLLDGIDLRETIRNWHTGKIFVQECMTVKGEIDALVVIFDEDMTKYPYTVTWLGEHNQESDMAFYATDPEEREVGPGIRKSVYGGFLMTMPPGRLSDVFHDPAYRIAQNYAERLLLAAIDYGLEKFVIYAAPKPPRPFFQVVAGRYGKRVLYVPLAQLSPVMLKKIRTFHILADKSIRDYAKDYLW